MGGGNRNPFTVLNPLTAITTLPFVKPPSAPDAPTMTPAPAAPPPPTPVGPPEIDPAQRLKKIGVLQRGLFSTLKGGRNSPYGFGGVAPSLIPKEKLGQ
jgi:hypothetical protein